MITVKLLPAIGVLPDSNLHSRSEAMAVATATSAMGQKHDP